MVVISPWRVETRQWNWMYTWKMANRSLLAEWRLSFEDVAQFEMNIVFDFNSLKIHQNWSCLVSVSISFSDEFVGTRILNDDEPFGFMALTWGFTVAHHIPRSRLNNSPMCSLSQPKYCARDCDFLLIKSHHCKYDANGRNHISMLITAGQQTSLEGSERRSNFCEI